MTRAQYDYSRLPSDADTRQHRGHSAIAFFLVALPYRVLRSLLRPRKSRLANGIVALMACSLVICTMSIIDALSNPTYATPLPHYQKLRRRIQESTEPGRGNQYSEKVFIASNIIQEDLIRGVWGAALLELVNLLGPQNTFVSIFENDSTPGTVVALQELKQKLPCQSSVVTGAHISLDSIPSIIIPTGEVRVMRMTYLSEVRNRLLVPLDPPSQHGDASNATFTATQFDRILFLNDVFFDPIDAVQLLFSTSVNPTSGRAEYDAACAVDFVSIVKFHDTFATRDLEGQTPGFIIFPWFTGFGNGQSRSDVLSGKDAVRVRSCWSGMAVYDAAPFLTHPAAGGESRGNSRATSSAALRFRHETELYWEASECCLINADLAERDRSKNPRIYLNPYIRVAYDARTWAWIPTVKRVERGFRAFQYFINLMLFPRYNPRLARRVDQATPHERWIYDDDSLNGEKIRCCQLDSRNVTNLNGRWQRTIELPDHGSFCGRKNLSIVRSNLRKANSDGSGKNWEFGPLP